MPKAAEMQPSHGMYLLLVEDNPDVADNMVEFLEELGHRVDLAHEGQRGFQMALAGNYDALILDLMLPRMDGLTICRRLREAGRFVPVMMLTARDTLEDKLEGFASGTDDYMVKPFSLVELEARLLALMRRGRGESPRRLQVADLIYDLDAHTVQRAGQPLNLAPIPLKLLELLMRNAGRVVSRIELEQAVWGSALPDSDPLRAHLYQLRNTLDKPFPVKLLHTVHGIGYRLSPPDEAPH